MKIILCGALGRMGTAVREYVDKTGEAQITAGVDFLSPPIFVDFPLYKDFNFNTSADVIISFLPPSADINHLLGFAIRMALPLVICTTGLKPTELKAVSDASNSIPVLHSPNMSLGIAVMKEILSQISAGLHRAGFDIEIIEKHHKRKIDAPSGTAIDLANVIQNEVPEKTTYTYGRNGCEARGANEIGIHSIRGGGIFGEHSILFASENETLEIKHSALDRSVFAQGAVRAALFLTKMFPGLFTMEDVLFRNIIGRHGAIRVGETK